VGRWVIWLIVMQSGAKCVAQIKVECCVEVRVYNAGHNTQVGLRCIVEGRRGRLRLDRQRRWVRVVVVG
jgi:hypothetical protein